MAVAGRRCEHELTPRVGPRPHLVALAGVEDCEEPGAGGDRLAGAAADVDLAVDDDEVGALVDLVVLKELAGR